MTPTTDDLYDRATTQGLTLTTHATGPKGVWIPHQRRISLRYNLDPAQERCTLAHELIHAEHNDPPGHHPPIERRTDETASLLLISAHEYALAEHRYGPYPALIAADLNVTTHILQVWRTVYQRKHSTLTI